MNFLLMNRIYMNMQANAFLYHLRKLPIIKDILPASILQSKIIKVMFGIMGFLKALTGTFIASSIAIIGITYYGSRYLGDYFNVVLTTSDYAILFFVFNCLAPALRHSNIFGIHEEDHMFLNHFLVEPKKYYRYKILKQTLKDIVVTIPALMFIFWRDYQFIFLLLLCKFICLSFGHHLFLYFYDKSKKLPKKGIRICFSLILCIISLAFVFLCSTTFLLDYINLIFILVGSLFVIAFGLYLRLFYYNNFLRIARKYANKDVILLQVTVSSMASEESIALNHSTWESNKEFQEKNMRFQGFHYLDKAFMHRHKKAINSSYRSKIVLLFVVSILGGWFLRKESTQIDNLLSYAPIVFVIASFLSFGSEYSQMLFLHCDNYLMNNRVGLNQEVVYQSYLLRLKHLLSRSFVLGGFLLFDLFLFIKISNIHLQVYEFLFLCILSITLVIFMETYHLFIYYLLQPYTSEATIKSPFYRFTSLIELIVNFGFIFFRVNMVSFLIPVIAFVLLFILITLSIVKKYGYRTFVIH